MADDEREEQEEEDEPAAPLRRYITRSGAERLHRELLTLLKVERPKVTSEVSAAPSPGSRPACPWPREVSRAGSHPHSPAPPPRDVLP